jgi:acyl-CoA hydrolase
MDAKPVSQTRLRLAQMMTPNDANCLGKVFGGSILSLIDLTASAVSQKFAGALCVTAAFDRVDFLQPVEIGELVELDGFVSYVGRTSVEVTIQVHATNLRQNERRHVNTATVTMVNMATGKPTEVPRLICETADDKRRFVMGQLRRELHTARNQDLKMFQTQLDALSESELDHLMEGGPGIRERFVASTAG